MSERRLNIHPHDGEQTRRIKTSQHKTDNDDKRFHGSVHLSVSGCIRRTYVCLAETARETMDSFDALCSATVFFSNRKWKFKSYLRPRHSWTFTGICRCDPEDRSTIRFICFHLCRACHSAGTSISSSTPIILGLFRFILLFITSSVFLARRSGRCYGVCTR